MTSLEVSREDSTFKFPFTDNEDGDLNPSANYNKVRRSLRLATRNRSDNEGSSSELGLALSPIAKDRESSTSIMGYVEGDSLSLDSVDSVEYTKCLSQTPSGDYVEDNKSTEEQNAKELSEIPIPPTDSLESAMKQVGERSSDFIDKMRDATNKRMAAVTRSRDSLVAKEKEQLRSIAECESRLTTLKEKLQSAGETHKENQPFEHFRKKNNKPKKGFGGLGVPKVEKRPTTKPLSPKLGLRRNGGKTNVSEKKSKEVSERASAFRPIAKSTNITIYNDTGAHKTKTLAPRNRSTINTTRESIEKGGSSSKLRSSQQEEEESLGMSCGFKARPVPSSTTQRWNAGQLGIPKVSKRAVTIPVSPCLGPKRQTRIVTERRDKTHEESSNSKTRKKTSARFNGFSSSSRSIAMSPSSVQDSPLLGLDLINSTRREKVIIPEPNIDNTTQKRITFKPFVPRSTTRANMRKQYDIYRVEKRALSIQEKREQLQAEIKIIHRELKVLSKDLT